MLYSNSGKGGSTKSTRKSVKNKNPKSILILGDSYSISPPAFTWSSLVKKDLAEKGITVDVIAKGGQTTSWMLKKLTEAIKTKKYDRIYVWGGTNDGVTMAKPEDIVSNLQKMVDLGKENGADVFILKGYILEGYMSADKLYNSGGFPNISKQQWIPMIENFKKVKAKINADNIKNAIFIEDLNLGDKTGDGSHPNGEAHKIIAKAVLETI
jgi:lysophospholipase L1-like esterase